jgi:hypothetical protein
LDKNICWDCCNHLRYDLSCPASCPYSGKQEESSKAPFPAFKADSQTESRQVNSLYIDLWLDKKQDSLGGISPQQAAIENPKKLLDWLASYQYPPQFPIDYLMSKLNLKIEPAPQSAIRKQSSVDLWMQSSLLTGSRYLISASTAIHPKAAENAK